MKVLSFTIPIKQDDRTLIIQDEVSPYFYTHFHRHEEVQITWIKQGEGTLIVGNNMHTFRSGDIYILGANMPHLFKSDRSYFEPGSTKKTHAITLFFNTKGNLSFLLKLPEMKRVNLWLEHAEAGFKVPAENLSSTCEKINEILKTEGTEQFVKFLDLLYLMSIMPDLQPLTVNAYTKAINDNEGLRIASIYNYIIKNHKKQLSLEEVSRQAFMTPHAFCRYFKKHTRHTLVSFLNKIRINEACKMLVNGKHMGISDVAFACGFNSLTNFNRVFKSITGVSPRVYIEQFSE